MADPKDEEKAAKLEAERQADDKAKAEAEAAAKLEAEAKLEADAKAKAEAEAEAKAKLEAADPKLEAALAAQRQQLAEQHAAAIEAAKLEAREAALAEERKRLEDEAKLAAMSEAERQAAALERERERAAAAEEKVRQAEAAAKLSARQAQAATARADSGLSLSRNDTGQVDPALETLVFVELQQIAGDKPITSLTVAELAKVKPWMFAKVNAEPTNTGRAPGSRADPAPKLPEGNVLTMSDPEWRRAQRKLGMAPR